MLNPFVTMSALTGKPTKKGIHKYLSDLKALGIDQVMIYPRSGSEVEYLSEDWFCAVADFIDSAIILNMKLWLYDDFNWPSGDACGKVTKVEKFRLSSIKTKGEMRGRSPVCQSTILYTGVLTDGACAAEAIAHPSEFPYQKACTAAPSNWR